MSSQARSPLVVVVCGSGAHLSGAQLAGRQDCARAACQRARMDEAACSPTCQPAGGVSSRRAISLTGPWARARGRPPSRRSHGRARATAARPPPPPRPSTRKLLLPRLSLNYVAPRRSQSKRVRARELAASRPTVGWIWARADAPQEVARVQNDRRHTRWARQASGPNKQQQQQQARRANAVAVGWNCVNWRAPIFKLVPVHLAPFSIFVSISWRTKIPLNWQVLNLVGAR